MKKTIVLLFSLISIFLITCSIKIQAAINKPISEAGESETPWYESRYSTPVASEDWTLDPEIPEDYVPVPGEDEITDNYLNYNNDIYALYNENNVLIGYRQRVQNEDSFVPVTGRTHLFTSAIKEILNTDR